MPPIERTVQSSSLPRAEGHAAIRPSFIFTPEYIVRTVRTCLAPRQVAEGVSPGLHCRTPGSQRQAIGLFMMPSFSPSLASHAERTALLISSGWPAIRFDAGSLWKAWVRNSMVDWTLRS